MTKRSNLHGAKAGEVVKLAEYGKPGEKWLVVRSVAMGFDLFNLSTKEYLPNFHPSQVILEVGDLELVEDQA